MLEGSEDDSGRCMDWVPLALLLFFLNKCPLLYSTNNPIAKRRRSSKVIGKATVNCRFLCLCDLVCWIVVVNDKVVDEAEDGEG